MNKNLIYALIGCCMLTLTACNDSIMDATSKHVYSESESPYLKVNTDAVVTKSMEFSVGHFAAQTISLSDYADKFKANMNMTVDQVIAGLKDGTVVFYNISTTKNAWNKAAMTHGTTGWYYNSAGGVCTSTDETLTASIDIDTNAKTLTVNATSGAKAGTVMPLNVGFAVKGPDYDSYVRFKFNVSIVDPSIILTSITVPSDKAFSIDFNQYAAVIKTCMGMSVEEFLANLDNKSIHMYVIDPKTGVWDSTSDYTANPPGYWMNSLGAVCVWGTTGYTLYAETDTEHQILNLGRADGLTAGSEYKISVGYKDTKNEKNFFRFIITATLE